MNIYRSKKYGRFSCVYRNDLFVYPPMRMERFVLKYLSWFFVKIAWDDIGFRNFYLLCRKRVSWRLKPKLERNWRSWRHRRFYWEKNR